MADLVLEIVYPFLSGGASEKARLETNSNFTNEHLRSISAI